jgi:hypothetical protein
VRTGTGTGFVAGSNFSPRSVSDIISSGGGEKTTSLSSRSRLISSSKDSSSGNRRVSGVPRKLPSLLLAIAEVLAMALLSPAATLVRARRAAVAANAGRAAAGVAASGAAAAWEAATGVAAAGVAAAGAAAAGAAAAGAAAAGAAAAGAAAAGAAAAGAAAAGAAAAGAAAAGAAAAGAAAAGAAAAGAAAAGAGDAGAAAACAAAAEWRAALFVSFHTSRLFLSFSLLFSLGGLFLLRLHEVAAAEEGAVAAAVACLLLQQKLNCSSPSQVSRVRSAHLLSCTHPLYTFRRVANGWEGQCLSGGELLVLPTGGCTPPLPTTSAQEGAIVGEEWCVCCTPAP